MHQYIPCAAHLYFHGAVRFYIVAAGTKPGEGVAIARNLTGADGIDQLADADEAGAVCQLALCRLFGFGYVPNYLVCQTPLGSLHIYF